MDDLRIGIALGGGGAKGLAHIPLLEAIDDLGIRAHRVAGTSIGAIVGALYCSGQSGREIRESFDELLFDNSRSGAARFDILKGVQILTQILDFDVGVGGVLKGDRIMTALQAELTVETFEELEIPLQIVAVDFWNREQVVLDRGPIALAVRASMSLPGLFSPVVRDGKVLMDGGAINPVPFDLLREECDLVIAIDVAGRREAPGDSDIPGLADSIFNTFQIMSKAIVDSKLEQHPPDVILRPDIRNVRVLDFDKAASVYEQTETARQELIAQLEPLLVSESSWRRRVTRSLKRLGDSS